MATNAQPGLLLPLLVLSLASPPSCGAAEVPFTCLLQTGFGAGAAPRASVSLLTQEAPSQENRIGLDFFQEDPLPPPQPASPTFSAPPASSLTLSEPNSSSSLISVPKHSVPSTPATAQTEQAATQTPALDKMLRLAGTTKSSLARSKVQAEELLSLFTAGARAAVESITNDDHADSTRDLSFKDVGSSGAVAALVGLDVAANAGHEHPGEAISPGVMTILSRATGKVGRL